MFYQRIEMDACKTLMAWRHLDKLIIRPGFLQDQCLRDELSESSQILWVNAAIWAYAERDSSNWPFGVIVVITGVFMGGALGQTPPPPWDPKKLNINFWKKERINITLILKF